MFKDVMLRATAAIFLREGSGWHANDQKAERGKNPVSDDIADLQIAQPGTATWQMR